MSIIYKGVEVGVTLDGSGGGKTVLSGTDPPTAAVGNNGDIYLQYVEWTMPELPSGYTALRAIISTGTQYIDTGVSPNTDTSFEIDNLIFNSIGNYWNSVLGQGDVNGRIWAFRFRSSTGGLQFQIGADGDAISLFTPVIGTEYQVSGGNGSVTVNGSTYSGNLGTLTNPLDTLGLFGYAHGGYCTSVQLRACRIYDNGTLTRNFVAAKRDSDDEVGLYELQNDVFYLNNGTGSFSAKEEQNGEITAAYVKCGGTWEPLIGANIEDLN